MKKTMNNKEVSDLTSMMLYEWRSKISATWYDNVKMSTLLK